MSNSTNSCYWTYEQIQETRDYFKEHEKKQLMKELPKRFTIKDMEEFSHWYNRKVSVIGESELHLFGARPFQDIIDYWEQERRKK